jgi:hypothetical protein
MESIEVGWPEISDIFGTRILPTCIYSKYHGLQNILLDLFAVFDLDLETI